MDTNCLRILAVMSAAAMNMGVLKQRGQGEDREVPELRRRTQKGTIQPVEFSDGT